MKKHWKSCTNGSCLDVYDLFVQQEKVKSCYEKTWHLPKEIGKGFFTNITLKQGFNIFFQDWHFNRDFVTSAEISDFPLKFTFCLEGKLAGKAVNGKKDLMVSRGECSLGFIRDSVEGTMTRPAGQQIQVVNIYISVPLLQSYIGDDVAELPKPLVGIEEGRIKNDFELKSKITPQLFDKIKRLLNCSTHSLTQKMHCEARALELIAQFFDEITMGEEKKLSRKLSANDLATVCHAREVLLNNLEDPPSLSDLAGKVSVSHTKLIKCFRAAFGLTPFEYLKK